MKIKQIKTLRVNSYIFELKWDKESNTGSFDYGTRILRIGILNKEARFEILCHELMEIVALELNVRYRRPDCDSDYLFAYDHRQHDTIMNMFSSLLSQFIV